MSLPNDIVPDRDEARRRQAQDPLLGSAVTAADAKDLLVQHQEMLKDCSKCHSKAPGKIAELDKDWAHNTCKKCHSEGGKGPTKCGECHKK